MPSNKAQEVKDFTKEVKETILKGINPRTYQLELSAKPGVGEDYLEIQNVVDVFQGEETNIVHKQGEVMLVDFWATWCPPCQKPMAHNQHMLEQHGEQWGDRVRIIGLSIDSTIDFVQKHVKAKGWEKVQHYFRAGSSASKDYGVSGVPHVLLIDTLGKIVFAGHPSERDLEKDIETLLKGESLTGVKGGESGETDDKENEGYEEKDLEAIQGEMKRFEGEVKDMLLGREDLKEHCSTMMRDFVVLIRQTKYDGKQFLTSYENINVLVGPEKAIDALKPEIEKFLSGFAGNFKSDWRVTVR